jgi:hypothetical protein
MSAASRSCHVFIIYALIFIFNNFRKNLDPKWLWLGTNMESGERICRITITLLPLLWSLGSLSQVEPGFLWFLEQVNMFLLGGSTMSSPATLLLSVFCGSSTVTALFFVKPPVLKIVLAAFTGYICSMGFGEPLMFDTNIDSII